MLTHFEVTGVRNLQPVKLEFHQHLNLVCGPNASGKTSLLEAIAVLASGKSFRTSSLENVLNHQAERMHVFGRKDSGDKLGYQWSPKNREIRINGESASRLSQLAQALPLQSFTPDTHSEFTRSRRQRIAVLDWVLFHVEHGFHNHWSRYQKALAQRNAALKNSQKPDIWDAVLTGLGEKILSSRQQVLEKLKPAIQQYCQALPGVGDVRVRVKKGWSQDRSLADALQHDRERDLKEGFTHSGAHRSDLELTFDGRKVREEASQGQLKILVLALRLSQLKYYCEQTGDRCLFLLDDLPAELDVKRRQQVLSLLSHMPLQVFITSTEQGLVDLSDWPTDHQVFHVEQGKIT